MSIEMKKEVLFRDKISLVEAIVEVSLEDGLCNPLVLKMYYDLYMMLTYSEMEIPEGASVVGAYEGFLEDGTIDEFLGALDPDEDRKMWRAVQKYLEYCITKQNSAVGIVSGVMDLVSGFIAEEGEALKSLDLSQLTQITSLADSLGINLGQATTEAKE